MWQTILSLLKSQWLFWDWCFKHSEGPLRSWPLLDLSFSFCVWTDTKKQNKEENTQRDSWNIDSCFSRTSLQKSLTIFTQSILQESTEERPWLAVNCSLHPVCSKTREWLSRSELAVPRRECPRISLIPTIPSTVMSGHVFSRRCRRDWRGTEKLELEVVCVRSHASALHLPFVSWN